MALEASQPVRYLQETVATVTVRTLRGGPGGGGGPRNCHGWKASLHEVLDLLEPRLKRLLELRFLRKTQSEVAVEFGVSQVQVSRLEKEALRRLREILRE